MNFDDFLGKHRKSEPRVVLIMRIFTLIIISTCLIAYSIFLIKEVISEIPAIKTSEVTVDTLAIPDIVFAFDYPFQVHCYFIWTINGLYSRNETYSCTQYLNIPKYFEGQYIGYFSLNDQSEYFHYSKLEIDKERLDYLLFLIVVDDPNFNASMVSVSVPPPYTVIFDSENDPIKLSDGTIDLSLFVNYSHASSFEKDLLYSSIFVFPDKMLSTISFLKYTKRNIIPSWINNVGFFNYKETTYLKTKLDQGFYIGEIKPQYYSMMIIKPSSFISHIETEQRSNTYLGIFGVIGGAWGLVVGFYAFLFGESLIHPWGFIQKNCCRIKPKTQSKLRESLSILPLTDSSILDEKDKVEEVSVEEFNRMKEKLKSLEILLREYVIDVKFLQSVENGNIREA